VKQSTDAGDQGAVRSELSGDIEESQMAEAAQKVSEGDRLLREREAALLDQYRVNLRRPIVLELIRFEGMDFFGDSEWRLKRGFNLLLGRNGYGKSFLLRSTVALLKRDEQLSGALVGSMGGETARLHLQVKRLESSRQETIVRDTIRFESSIGEVPILAIPDSRFVDRSTTLLTVPDHEASLLKDGARHFLQQLPYNAVINDVLYELCLDYQQDYRAGFDLPVFAFLAGVITRLTEEPFQFDSIERGSRLGFIIWVRTPNSPDPLPIQYSSQGTLSVLAIFGLIRSFLKELARSDGRSAPSEDEIRGKEAIVVIDELDAHLHPVWQQQMRVLLTDSFPKVQFIVSAHSPLLVAGCGAGEVSVLRRQGGRGFEPALIERDFIGATSAELYESVFDIEELDPTFLRYKTKLTNRSDHDSRINSLVELQKRGKLAPKQAAELEILLDEEYMMDRVEQVTEARDGREHEQSSRILELEAENERLRARLRTADRPKGKS
jgi:energy-coupling factor transporter ATP-binding protein EcfA2